jgi:protein-L-isoaspartate(D-aspartate) O-methyltransferase
MGSSQDFIAARRTMLDAQIRTNDVPDRRVHAAFLGVQRELFVSKAQRQFAYADLVLETLPGRFLWRARDFSKLVQSLEVAATDIALVIAGGAGYSSAVIAKLCDTVIVLDSSDMGVATATARLTDAGADNAVAVKADLKKGWPKDSPFDVIFVDGAVGEVPQVWLDQLAEGGRLGVVVREGRVGRARLYTKTNGVASFRILHESTAPEIEELKAADSFVF